MIRCSSALSAGFAPTMFLLAFTPTHAQQMVSTPEIPHSILSLASAPRPQGQALARNLNDAKFERVSGNYHVFAAATGGESSGTETLQLNFDGSTRLAKIESKTKDFVVESGGSCHEGAYYSKGDNCSILVRFAPQGPGHRSGSLNISHSAEPTPMFVGLAGNGYSPVVSFTPSQISTVPGTAGSIASSNNLSVDGGDILYIPDVGNNLIKQIDSSGTIATLKPVFATPQTLVADSSGVMYSANISGSTYYFSIYYPYGTQSAYGTTYSPGSCTPSTPCNLGSVGMSQPANISIDPYDNLFLAEQTKGAVEMPVANVGGGNGTINLWYLTDQYNYPSGSAASFAVDASDNVYNYYNYNTSVCYLQEEPLYNAEYSPTSKRVAGGSACGYSGDGGQARSAEISSNVGQITFDAAGNLYFSDTGNQRIRKIEVGTGIITTIAGTGTQGYSNNGGAATTASISNPSGLAVDSQGQVYFLMTSPNAGPTQLVRKVGTLGYWNYNSVLIHTTSAVKVFSVSNTGNSALTLTNNAQMLGSNPADFAIDSSTTTCNTTNGATLAAGHSCNIGIKFTPSATGTRSAMLTLFSNTVNGTNSIQVTGTGTLPYPTMKITSPSGGSSVKTGTTVTFAVSVTSTSTTKPTGTVTFKVNGSNVGSPVTLSTSGTASTTFTESSASSYTLSAAYSGDANYSATTVSESLTVTASVVKAASVVNLSSDVVAMSFCSLPHFSVRVSSDSKGSPTGVIQLMSGTSAVASSTLTNGSALLSPGQLRIGSHTLFATYAGDSQHEAATSTPVTFEIVPSRTGSCGIDPRPIVGSSHF